MKLVVFHQRAVVKMLEGGNIERKISGKRNQKGKRRRREVGHGVEMIGRGDQEDRMKKGGEVMKKGIEEEKNEKVY